MELEADIGDELGLDIHVVDIEDVVDGELDRALERLPGADGCSVLYRGWMLTGEEYGALHEALGGGLCFRRLLPLRRLGVTDRGYPIHDEHRLFLRQGDLVTSAPQHDLRGARLDPTEFGFLGERIESPFFTADVARLEDGRWTIVELGDGGVSMLPSALDPRDLYRAMIPGEL